jgi:hypothetical protein
MSLAETGFGLKLLRKTLFNAPDGVEIAFPPAGLSCRICLAEVRDA